MKSSKPHEDFCNILLEELFIHISNKLNKSANSITDGFNQLLEIMDLTCAKNNPIKFYAEQIHFSEVYFVKFFKKAMGVSPHKYLMKLRMEKAISMLIYTKALLKTFQNNWVFQISIISARFFTILIKYHLRNFVPKEKRKNNKVQAERICFA